MSEDAEQTPDLAPVNLFRKLINFPGVAVKLEDRALCLRGKLAVGHVSQNKLLSVFTLDGLHQKGNTAVSQDAGSAERIRP